jgi:(p)ppGpp synthase/HD superfamily hydrolase
MNTQIRNSLALNETQVLPWYALWCIQAHGNQMYGKKPYKVHLAAVAKLAVRYGFTTELILMVCWLHDVLEDCPDQSVETLLAAGFPPEAVAAAYALKDEDGATRDEKKAKTLPKIAANRVALIVKLCDRLANVLMSRRHRNRKFKRYQHEQVAFKAALYDPTDLELAPMWKRLERLLAD